MSSFLHDWKQKLSSRCSCKVADPGAAHSRDVPEHLSILNPVPAAQLCRRQLIRPPRLAVGSATCAGLPEPARRCSAGAGGRDRAVARGRTRALPLQPSPCAAAVSCPVPEGANAAEPRSRRQH